MNGIQKTGGWTHLEEAGEYVYGDIYQIGDVVYVRQINTSGNLKFSAPEGETIWATIPRIVNIFKDERMVTIVGTGKVHFEYDPEIRDWVATQ